MSRDSWSSVPFLKAASDESRGHAKIKRSDYQSVGTLAVVDQGQGLIGGFTDDEASASHVDLPVIIFGDHTRAVKYIDFPFAVGADGVKVLKPSPGIDARYLYHFMRTLRITDGGYSRHFKYLKETEVPLPPIEEQRRIAAVLDAADALRAKRRKVLAKLDTLTQAIFIDMFGHPLGPDRRWKMRSLADLGRVHTGKTPPGQKSGMFGDAVPFMTPGDLQSPESAQRWLSHEGAAHSRVVPPGSTLVCCIGATIGKVGQATEESAFNQQINAIDWDRAAVVPAYGTYAMRFLGPEVARRGASTTLPLLKKSSFERLEIPTPPLQRQAQFATTVDAVSEHSRLGESHGVGLDGLFASLQQRAFRGDL